MPAFRHLLVLVAAAGAAAVFAAPSSAAVDNCPAPPANRPAMPHCLATQHFEIWYTSDTGDPAYTTFTEASDFAALYEHVYATELGYGFPAPLDDGDGKIDVYITTLSSGELGLAGPEGLAVPDNSAGPTSSGLIEIDASQLGADTEAHVLAHELFHLIQLASWVPQLQTDTWLFEGSAEWMGAMVSGYQETDVAEVGPSDMPLDCRENLIPSPPFQMCNPDMYIEGGYSRWPFFQYLSQRFGVTFVNSVFVMGGAGGRTATQALQDALTAKGTSLSNVYNDWATAQMTGYGIATLDAVKPTAYGPVIAPGVATTTTPISEDVNVDHLATRYLEFVRGNGDSSTACSAATLSLSVTVPAGTLSRPTFYWDGGGTIAVPLSMSGNTATASIPWDTCDWTTGEGFLSLPNASYTSNSSTAVDTADFHVTYSLTVDTTKPATASPPPAPASTYGQVVPVTSSSVSPAISVFGPQLLKLSATATQIRLIVESSGEGSVKATLGSLSLGSSTIRPGENDLRFSVPKSALLSLRRSADATSLLTLTPVSADGSQTGTAVTRQVSIAPAKPVAKPAPKAKPKTKAKTKAKGK
jgi:hypothetical protein